MRSQKLLINLCRLNKGVSSKSHKGYPDGQALDEDQRVQGSKHSANYKDEDISSSVNNVNKIKIKNKK